VCKVEEERVSTPIPTVGVCEGPAGGFEVLHGVLEAVVGDLCVCVGVCVCVFMR
jgi:hypothetical protein